MIDISRWFTQQRGLTQVTLMKASKLNDRQLRVVRTTVVWSCGMNRSRPATIREWSGHGNPTLTKHAATSLFVVTTSNKCPSRCAGVLACCISPKVSSRLFTFTVAGLLNTLRWILMSPAMISEAAYDAHFSSRSANSSKNVVLTVCEPGHEQQCQRPTTDVNYDMFKRPEGRQVDALGTQWTVIEEHNAAMVLPFHRLQIISIVQSRLLDTLVARWRTCNQRWAPAVVVPRFINRSKSQIIIHNNI